MGWATGEKVNDLINAENPKIYIIRGAPVMLDRDVAKALGVELRELNENAKRSKKWQRLRDRDIEPLYRIQASASDLNELKSQNAIMNETKYLPWLYTQIGCAHFGTSLTSVAACDLAIRLSARYVNTSEILPVANGAKEALKLYPGAHAVAHLLYSDGNQAKLAALKLVRRETSYDLGEAMGMVYLPAPRQEPYFCPRDLGRPFNISAQKINEMLVASGLQYKNKESGKWEHTLKAQNHYIYSDVAHADGRGKNERTLRWYRSVLTMIGLPSHQGVA
jgi:hypothetical protein